MEAIGDLPRLWCTPRSSLGIETVTVAAHRLDRRMPTEPVGGGFRRAVRQDIENFP